MHLKDVVFKLGWISWRYVHLRQSLYFDMNYFRKVNLSPNVIMMGSMKSGTTSLYNTFKKHQEIFVSNIKEPGFFLDASDERFKPSYRSPNEIRGFLPDEILLPVMIRGYVGQKCIVDASTHYTKLPEFGHEVPQKIKRQNPKAKFIYIVRNPFDRMVSQYLHLLRGNFTVEQFNTAIERDELLTTFSCYYFQLENYLKYFDKRQFKIIVFEELISNPTRVLNALSEFLEISKFPAGTLLGKDNVSENREKMPLKNLQFSQSNRARLMKIFESDIEKLEREFPYPYREFWNFSSGGD